MIGRAWGSASRYPLTAFYMVTIAVFAVAFAVAFRQINDTSARFRAEVRRSTQVDREVRAQACEERQHGWDNRRQAWLVLTAPTVFPPSATVSPENRIATAVGNERRAHDRTVLLAGLGPRPVC